MASTGCLLRLHRHGSARHDRAGHLVFNGFLPLDLDADDVKIDWYPQSQEGRDA